MLRKILLTAMIDAMLHTRKANDVTYAIVLAIFNDRLFNVVRYIAGVFAKSPAILYPVSRSFIPD